MAFWDYSGIKYKKQLYSIAFIFITILFVEKNEGEADSVTQGTSYREICENFVSVFFFFFLKTIISI